MRLNSAGFSLDEPENDWIDPSVLRLSQATGLAPWLALAGPHGEFELVFTVPADRRDQLDKMAAGIGWQPAPIGRVVEDPGIWLGEQPLDVARMRNLFAESEGDIQKYFAGLLQMAAGIATGGDPS
jgi:thiamine-monophosphate kinase